MANYGLFNRLVPSAFQKIEKTLKNPKSNKKVYSLNGLVKAKYFLKYTV